MIQDIYCPNKACPNHKAPPRDSPWFRKKGFLISKREGRIQRYQCKHCLRTFDLNYFSLNYYVHRKLSYRTLLNHLVTGSGIRDMSRSMHCGPKVISHRIQRLAQRITAVCTREIARLELTESVAADGLENFILSQYFPTNVNILMGNRSQFLYTFNSYHFRRKGKCTEEQKVVKERLYESALFEKGASSKRFAELLDFLAEKAIGSSQESFVLDTDEHPVYRAQFSRHPTIGHKVFHRVTNSKVERNYQNKLFPCNYMDRQIRKDLAEYLRETVQFGRNMNNSMDRFACYGFWHNFIKPFRINKRKSPFKYHGEAAGFPLKDVRRIVHEVFHGLKMREDQAREYLTEFQQIHMDHELVNPLCRSAL